VLTSDLIGLKLRSHLSVTWSLETRTVPYVAPVPDRPITIPWIPSSFAEKQALPPS
jgi:hypothetical protein